MTRSPDWLPQEAPRCAICNRIAYNNEPLCPHCKTAAKGRSKIRMPVHHKRKGKMVCYNVELPPALRDRPFPTEETWRAPVFGLTLTDLIHEYQMVYTRQRGRCTHCKTKQTQLNIVPNRTNSGIRKLICTPCKEAQT